MTSGFLQAVRGQMRWQISDLASSLSKQTGVVLIRKEKERLKREGARPKADWFSDICLWCEIIFLKSP